MSNRLSLWKQIAGAVVGGSLGLLVYSGYQIASPYLTAWTSIPQRWLPSGGEGSTVADKDRTDRTNPHFEARAKEIAKEFGAAYKNYQIKEETPKEEEVSDAGAKQNTSSEESSTAIIPFDAATDTATSSEESSSSDGTESDLVKATRKPWDAGEITTAPGPDTDTLPDSGIGLLAVLVAAGAGAGGLQARKRK